jgi:hypothetical protein
VPFVSSTHLGGAVADAALPARAEQRPRREHEAFLRWRDLEAADRTRARGWCSTAGLRAAVRVQEVGGAQHVLVLRRCRPTGTWGIERKGRPRFGG